MKKGRTGREDKGLLAMLGILCVVIAGLVVGLVMIVNQKTAEEAITEESEEVIEVNDEVEAVEGNEEVIEDITKALDAAYKVYEAEPSASVAHEIYLYEKMLGNEERAEEYRKKAEEMGFDFEMEGQG